MGKGDTVRVILKCFLTVVFLLAALCKVYPHFHPEAFIDMDVMFREKIGPLWQDIVFDQFNYKMSSVNFKFMIGVSEILIVIMLWGGSRMSSLACALGFCVMVGATLTHYILKEHIVFPFILGTCFLVVLKLGMKSSKPVVVKKKN